MSTASNGQQPVYRDPNRRLRFDNLTSILTGVTAGTNPSRATATAELPPRGHSGRRFVLVAGFHRAVDLGCVVSDLPRMAGEVSRASAYGLTQVVPAIDPLAEITPPSLDPMHRAMPCTRHTPCW